MHRSSSPYRVAFIESTASQTGHLRQLLQFEGITVIQLVADVLRHPVELPVDLLVLDHQQPPMSGTRTTGVASGAVRQPRPLTLALVGAGKELHGIELVERGLDAYMVVPCGAREFVARVRALLRRTRGSDTATERRDATGTARMVRIRDLHIDPSRRRVRMGDQNLRLTEQEFQLLYFLAGNPGRVFDRQALLDAVWGADTFVTSRSVDALVKRLRQQLRGPSRGSSLVETVRGVGYRLTDAGVSASITA